MQHPHAVVGRWAGGFNESALKDFALALRSRLQAPQVDLALLFTTPSMFDQAEKLLEVLRVHGQASLLVGCSSQSLIANDAEFEGAKGLVLGLYSLPGVRLTAVRFQQEQVEEAAGGAYWPMETGVAADDTNGWLAFADPFHLDAEAWLRSWNESYEPLPVLGGLASGDHSARLTQVYLDGAVHTEGGVAVSVGGDVELQAVIAQGCMPIGEPWPITRAEGNVIHEIGNRPAYQVLMDTFNGLNPEERERAKGNLFVGLVINEYQEDFHQGDFLIRNLLAADPKSGAIAIGAFPRVGQTLQFQRRDAQAAEKDMADMLDRAARTLGRRTVMGGVLCSCNGRGSNLFDTESHDARSVARHLGTAGIAGFFCNGEIGPVGGRNFLHGYTASLGLFVGRPARA